VVTPAEADAERVRVLAQADAERMKVQADSIKRDLERDGDARAGAPELAAERNGVAPTS
jgi:hypothetical protein